MDGQPYALLKFRSMREDAEHDGVPRWAAVGDNRITRVGAFIRTTRIDELPQIFCVLRGHMSFIGPRPERPYFVNELIEQLPYYGQRHRVRPGISGWAQINYPYGASVEDARAKLTYDLYYIKNYSIFLDMIILIETIRVVLWPRGVR
jgi:lipopolysaccharide/colanic/teichoic acid biosynthesis glycosyltransferase